MFKISEDSPKVKIPPPLGVVVAFFLAVGLNYFAPAPFLSGVTRWVAGGALIIVAVFLLLRSALLFKKHRTHIEPWRPALTLLREGPYRFSRNPIYLSFLIFTAGLICWVNNAYAWFLLLPLFLFLDLYVIRREENYLTQKFGEEYGQYRTTSRRWL